jgi:hypothetical protein
LPFPEVALKNGVAEIRAKNPNLSFTNAYNQLMREQPKLFVEATGPALETDRDQRISDACQEIMKKNPGMMFETAYNLLVQTRPDLFPGAHGVRDGERRKEEKVRELQAQIHAEIKERERTASDLLLIGRDFDLPALDSSLAAQIPRYFNICDRIWKYIRDRIF